MKATFTENYITAANGYIVELRNNGVLSFLTIESKKVKVFAIETTAKAACDLINLKQNSR
jgi:hypothetical protein